MDFDFQAMVRWLFGPDFKPPGYLAARWLFLRALALIFFSAFYSLAFQIRGLIGPDGILPAQEYLRQVSRVFGASRFWHAPTLFWWSSSDRFLLGVCLVGLAASVLLFVNFSPRGMIVICLVCFLSFIAAARDFASYQSDGMLLEAGFISLFFAPPGWWPRWGSSDPPSRASRFLLIWLMFRIYFESGIAKILGGDPEWRHLTAMDEYYQNGPLPTWLSWYATQLPHWFHAATAALTLALELALIFAIFLPRRFRIALFFLITAWQAGIILTSNYAFLNYLVLVLGFLLLDDKFLARILPRKLRPAAAAPAAPAVADHAAAVPVDTLPGEAAVPTVMPEPAPARPQTHGWHYQLRLWVQAFFLTWIFYATSALLLFMLVPGAPLPQFPIQALEPFRIANDFGLFAVMTRGRYEIEFQGSNDGQTWAPYPFRYKPQDVRSAPRIYAPYQPRFDWNLWFASLGNWQEYPWVIRVEQSLLAGEPDVLSLFGKNPFPAQPPDEVRVLIWQYWFTDRSEKSETGAWWRREEVGRYGPTLERTPEGKIIVLEMPDVPLNFR